VGLSLVALDTDHIKQYVFGTDKLKEIRGASSILDQLNRQVMRRLANDSDIKAIPVYAHGGSGQFLVDSEKVDLFAQRIKGAYSTKTNEGTSISYAVQPLPDVPLEKLWTIDISDELELLRWWLHDEKNCPPKVVTLPSHPFMKTCDACGLEYAGEKDPVGKGDGDEADQDGENQDKRYCLGCWAKRYEDGVVKTQIKGIVRSLQKIKAVPTKDKHILWGRLISQLHELKYEIPRGTNRPRRFDDFSEGRAKDYLGLIYADANNMGKRLELITNLTDTQKFAEIVDNGVYRALAVAIKEHTVIKKVAGEDVADDVDEMDDADEEEDVNEDVEQRRKPLFPFDVLLIGGDDIIIVTHASVAMQIARTMAQEFYSWTSQQFQQSFPAWSEEEKQGLTLSIGVVLAPIKYPFGLLFKLVDGTLQAAKKKGAELPPGETYGKSCINFVTVTGNTSPEYKTVYDRLQRDVKASNAMLYATLRPYTLSEMDNMLELLQKGHAKRLGRTKLHQIREAVLERNLSTSVVAGISALRNWKDDQRTFIVRELYAFGRPDAVPADATNRLGQVTFPWYYDSLDQQEREVYRTPLLDFVEPYDYVGKGEIDQ
jgi:hypothetical protein